MLVGKYPKLRYFIDSISNKSDQRNANVFNLQHSEVYETKYMHIFMILHFYAYAYKYMISLEICIWFTVCYMRWDIIEAHQHAIAILVYKLNATNSNEIRKLFFYFTIEFFSTILPSSYIHLLFYNNDQIFKHNTVQLSKKCSPTVTCVNWGEKLWVNFIWFNQEYKEQGHNITYKLTWLWFLWW